MIFVCNLSGKSRINVLLGNLRGLDLLNPFTIKVDKDAVGHGGANLSLLLVSRSFMFSLRQSHHLLQLHLLKPTSLEFCSIPLIGLEFCSIYSVSHLLGLHFCSRGYLLDELVLDYDGLGSIANIIPTFRITSVVVVDMDDSTNGDICIIVRKVSMWLWL